MRTAVSLTVLVVLVVGGCDWGSGSTSTQGGTQSTNGQRSRAAFIEVEDTICANHRSRREDLESQARDLGPISSPGKAHQIAVLLRQESENRLAETRELADRPAQFGDDSAVASVLSLLRAQARVIRKWGQAYDGLDSNAIRRLQLRLAALTARAARRAKSVGFEVCGQG